MVSMLHRDAGLAMVHVPKTGGTALGAALMRARDGWEEAADLPGLKAGMAAHDLALRRRVYTPRHARALDMRGALGGAAWRGLFSFAVLRDPYARMASTYHYIRSRPANPLHGFCNRAGLAEYIVLNCLQLPQLQADWVCDPSGNILVNRLYSTATLSDAAEELAARSGDRIDLQVEHSSPNRAIDPRHSFDGVPDWVMVLFHDTYAADFTLSGHAMDPDRVRQSVSPGGGGWEALAQELAPRIAKQAARLHHLERQLAAKPQITVK